MAVDGAGNLFIADRGNYRIRKVSTSGIITTVAGNGAWASPAMAGQPPARQLVAVAAWRWTARATCSSRTRQLPRPQGLPDGIITTVAGDGTHGLRPETAGQPPARN